MKNYVSLIADIENSRGYSSEDRNVVQTYVTECITILNSVFSDNMEFDVTFSAGDEIQGLFSDLTTAIMYYRMLEMLVSPVRLRAGIGIGEWTVKVKNGLSTQQDGPVYHRARQAITQTNKMQLQNIRIVSDENMDIPNFMLNASNSLKYQLINMQSIVFVIMEVVYPFVKEKDLVDKNEMYELINLKCCYKMNKTKVININEDIYYTCTDFIFIDGKIQDAENIIIKKNMSSRIAGVLGCTRQNADTILKRGNIYKIREQDYMALQYIEKTYGEKKWD